MKLALEDWNGVQFTNQRNFGYGVIICIKAQINGNFYYSFDFQLNI